MTTMYKLNKALILAFLLVTALLFPKVSFAEVKKTEPQVTVSNINAESFTVTWFSDEKTDRQVTYGKTEAMGTQAPDDRGKDPPRLTHHVTLKGLTPATDYFFQVAEGGRIYKQKTAPALPATVIPPIPERFRGTIVTEDKLTPKEAIIYFKTGGSSLLTSVMNNDGTYQILTTNMRTDNFNAYFKVEELKYVDFFVRTGTEGEAIRKVFAYARRDPIDFQLLAPRIPFYKIILPGFIDSPAQPAGSNAPAAAAAGGPPTGDTQGFFGTIWERFSAIFR